MASGVALHAFNWNSFQKLVTESPDRLATSVVEVMRDLGCDEELPDLFESGDDPIEKVKSVISSHDWNSAGHGLEEETLDDIVHRIFEAELPELEVETVGCGIMFGLLRVVTGEMKVNLEATGMFPYLPTNKPANECALVETYWLGGRFFRGFDQEANPVPHTETVREDEYPLYSIHSPEQVKQIYNEVMALEEESENWPDDEMSHNFMSDFLEPIEVAANNGLAIFAMSDT